MSIFNVLTGGGLGSALEALVNQAKSTATNLPKTEAGGVGGLLGAGALGALLGNAVSNDLAKNAALLGAGAVAWNFYKKWAANRAGQQAQNVAQPAALLTMNLDPTAELVMRAMIFAARGDGTIDAVERQRIDAVLQKMLPGQDVSGVLEKMQTEMLDPARISAEVTSPEQGEDIYRLSCTVIDIDHFMERGYMDALAKALNINDSRKAELETEAIQARRQLMAAIPQ